MPDVQAKRKIHKGNDCASCELREETSGAGIGKILYVARTKEKESHKPVSRLPRRSTRISEKRREEAVDGRKMGLRSRKTQQETKHERKTDGAGHPPGRKNRILISPRGDRAEVSTF